MSRMILVRIRASSIRLITAGIQDGGRSFAWSTASLVGIYAIVADRLLALGRQVREGGSNEVRSLENFEIAFGVVVVALGAVDGQHK